MSMVENSGLNFFIGIALVVVVSGCTGKTAGSQDEEDPSPAKTPSEELASFQLEPGLVA
jgi:hypothetical protein